MNRASPLIAITCCLLASCGVKSDREPIASAPVDISSITQAMASNQSIRCAFSAEVLRLSRIVAPSGRSQAVDFETFGHVIDPDPHWEVKLAVQAHSKKIPFQSGERLCYISNVESVFGVPADQVAGHYDFTFTWNIAVPTKPEFENFKAHKKEQNK